MVWLIQNCSDFSICHREIALDETTLPLLRMPGRLPLGELTNLERVEKWQLSRPDRQGLPDVKLIVYRPAGKDAVILPCIYHVHSGGFVSGTAAGLEPLHRVLVKALDCVLVTVDYRLAPEAPYPAPLDDCYVGELAWLVANAQQLKIDTGKLGVMGESAGGGLAAALALFARNQGGPPLAFQHLIYPMLDDRTCTAEPHPYAGAFVWNMASNAFGWRSYLGTEPGGDQISGYAAPARAENLAGLPPAFIATGALDLFAEENVAYAMRLLRAGVPVELHVYSGGFHGFDIDQAASVSRQMRRDSWDCLKRQFKAAPMGRISPLPNSFDRSYHGGAEPEFMSSSITIPMGFLSKSNNPFVKAKALETNWFPVPRTAIPNQHRRPA